MCSAESKDAVNYRVHDLDGTRHKFLSLQYKEEGISKSFKAFLKLKKNQCRRLQEQLEQERQEFEQRTFKEQGALKEQLQVHIQTIGILVSEKSELQGLASQARSQLKQKSEEAADLSSSLKASRQRVAELERNLLSVNSSTNKLQKTQEDINKERDLLQNEVTKLRKSREEINQQNSELKSQLTTKISENRQLVLNLKELQERLNMSDLRIQQLAAQGGQDAEGAVQRLQEEKVEVENKLTQSLPNQVSMEMEINLMRQTIRYKDEVISELESAIEDFMFPISRDGILRWPVKLSAIQQAIMTGSENGRVILSQDFYTREGHRMAAKLLINAGSPSEEISLGLFVVLKEGPHDTSIDWPFPYSSVSFQVLHHNAGEPWEMVYPFDHHDQAFSCPHGVENERFGFLNFISLEDLLCQEYKFIEDGKVFIMVSVNGLS